ncbi:MAG: hypothetical protein WCD11_22590 [Solirubrobacteraceae bacterium]
MTGEYEAECEASLTLRLRLTELVDRVPEMRYGTLDVCLTQFALRHAGQNVDRLERHERIAGRLERRPDAVKDG